MLLLVFLFVFLAPSAWAWDAWKEMDFSQSISGYLEAPHRGTVRYYAQNDPIWGMMSHRFPHQEIEPRFSGTGCVPSAVANCIANLVPRERLSEIGKHSYLNKGFFICPCSMNRMGCDGTHSRYQLTDERDFDEFFSLAVGSYLSGNNEMHEYACGTMFLTGPLLSTFGLSYVRTDNLNFAAREVMLEGAQAVLMVSGPDCPFTSGSHALVLCDADLDNYYFLDSFFREEYPLDQMQIVTILAPGLVAVPQSQAYRLGAYDIFVVYPPGKAAPTESP